MRVIRLAMFIGSTVEEIEEKFSARFGNSLCPGNIVKTELYKLGGVYQYEVVYAEFLPKG